jgi:hypothetical protein
MADYNGHYGIREICDICPAGQIGRCASGHRTPELARVKALAKIARLDSDGITVDHHKIELGGSSEQQRYFIQHALNCQVHDRAHPHLYGLHGRAEFGWD